MAKVEIVEKFQVDAAPEQVFRFLIDPERVVTCLPGATLTEIQDPTHFLGTVKVRVGPVTISYKGTIVLELADEASLAIEMKGTGTEKGGAGKATMVMKSHVVAAEGGGSEVTVDAEIDLAGKIVRFGRGMIKGVSKQLFGDFVKAVKERLESAEAAAEEAVQPAAADEAAVDAAPKRLPTTHEAKPIGAFSLLFRATWAGIKGFFARLLGKKKPPT